MMSEVKKIAGFVELWFYTLTNKTPELKELSEEMIRQIYEDLPENMQKLLPVDFNRFVLDNFDKINKIKNHDRGKKILKRPEFFFCLWVYDKDPFVFESVFPRCISGSIYDEITTIW